MQVYVFRHGIAEPGSESLSDADRPLSPLGIERTHAAAKGLSRFANRPQVILTSPKLRARQSANLLGEVFDMTPVVVEELADAPAMDVIRMLGDRQEEQVLIVGHEPTLSEVIETLCTHTNPPGFVDLKKAACAYVDAPLHANDLPGPGVLKWLMPPRALRALANGS